MAQEDAKSTNSRWALVRYVVLGLLAAAIIVIIILLIVHHNKKPNNTAGQSQTNHSTQSSKPTLAVTTPAPSTSSNDNQSTQTLSNTGPGSVLIIFAGTSALGSILHYGYRRRRA